MDHKFQDKIKKSFHTTLSQFIRENSCSGFLESHIHPLLSPPPPPLPPSLKNNEQHEKKTTHKINFFRQISY